MEHFDYIFKRIEDKKSDYKRYGFTEIESHALKTFFDLAQEFESIEDVYRISVAIPKTFFDLDARLYIKDPKVNRLALVSSTQDFEEGLGAPPPDVRDCKEPCYVNNALILMIRGNNLLIEQLPLVADCDVMGLLEVYPCADLGEHQELFFQKYANRIGFSLHLRFLLQKNIEHVKFIKGLVADIEHNVIVPNMVYRLFLRRLRGKILKNREVEKLLRKLDVVPESQLRAEIEPLLAELTEVNRGLMEEFRNIERHYQNTSLFLETLLRKSHFDEGQLTLRTKACNMKKAVVLPQLERYAKRFAESGIAIDDEYSGIPEEDTIAVVDIGIMAQVYANLFSNALKYTQEVITEKGERKKYVSYGRQDLKDYFGPGKDGIKYNVFSTGPHVAPDELEKIFQDGYRGSNSSNRPGTGHGLAFVRNAVEMHGGVVGYEATQYGNNFYFVLPK
ncbi:MAG: sensor histidine kinase [Deltaproteobacteria bacterium]|nr:sensor histidine kinase [Deltaproteobacteria bacterium]MBW2075253.1 sensor histidine kinase [Deltaproteobacteria bacterium]RLB81894.1 MAG: sensor histidine kinase [Deltaproteobacteria bacterium]